MKFTKKNILIICFVVLFIVFDSILGVMLYAQKKVSNLQLEFLNSDKKESLVSLDSNSKNALIKKNNQANFNFTDNQKLMIGKTFSTNNNASLAIRFQLFLDQDSAKQTNNLLEYGFLDENQKKTITVKGNEKELLSFSKQDSLIFDVSLAFSKTNNGSLVIPEGFYVYSDYKCKILSACVTPSVVGYDISSDIPFFGFSSNGGNLSTNFASFDFTGASLIFPSQNTKNAFMPEYVVKYSSNEECFSTLDLKVEVEMNVGSEKIKMKCVKNMKESIIPASYFKKPFSVVEISKNPICITSVIMRNFSNLHNSVIEESANPKIPIRADPGLMLYWNVDNWRNIDYELFEWDRFPGILFFDTRNYTVQDNFFRRLAFFAEKEGYKGKLLTNKELGTMHGFNALDYRPETFADFFNLAYEKNFELNKEEILLKEILIENGILIDDNQKVKPGYGGVVSISRESPDYLRIQLINHEAWHTLYFIDEGFKSYVATVYCLIDEKSLNFLIDYFRSQPQLGYDVNDDYLMKNEFMAYLIQQRVEGVADYFINHANWQSVRKFTPDLCDYVINSKGQGFVDAAESLNQFVFEQYGLIAGDVRLVK